MKSGWALSLRRLLLLYSTLAVILFIFFHSLMTAQESGAVSGALHQRWEAIFGWLPFYSHLFLRKAAHFAEYALLGLHVPFYAVLWRKGAWASACLFAVAVLDEGVQRLVPGRAASLVDVALDLGGVCFGALLSVLFLLALGNRQKKKEKM